MGLAEDIYGPKIDQETQPTHVYEYQNTRENRSWAGALPLKQGLYDPEYEKDACGVGFAAFVLPLLPFLVLPKPMAIHTDSVHRQPHQGQGKP